MILITGGLGFIGSHAARALLDLGESCVLTQRRAPLLPAALAGEAGGRVAVEQVDVTDRAALLALGRRHPVSGIVHLAAGAAGGPGDPIDTARAAVATQLNVLEAARDWGVARVGVASTIGVYGGAGGESPLPEDLPLPMTAGHAIPAFKKVAEVLDDYIADATGLEVVNYRIAAVWGPGGRAASPFFPAPQLVHAAARGTAPDFAPLPSVPYAGDGHDLCYVKDCGRAIALLQLAGRLHHRTYNVASGRATSNGELVAAIKRVVPEAQIELPEGRDPNGPGRDLYLDITRLRQDTGYQPAYDTGRAVADYLDWLRAGNERLRGAQVR